MFRIPRLRLQIKFWKALGRLAIWLRDSGQRCCELYEQHSPMKIVMDGWAVTPDTICPICGKAKYFYLTWDEIRIAVGKTR